MRVIDGKHICDNCIMHDDEGNEIIDTERKKTNQQ